MEGSDYLVGTSRVNISSQNCSPKRLSLQEALNIREKPSARRPSDLANVVSDNRDLEESMRKDTGEKVSLLLWTVIYKQTLCLKCLLISQFYFFLVRSTTLAAIRRYNLTRICRK